MRFQRPSADSPRGRCPACDGRGAVKVEIAGTPPLVSFVVTAKGEPARLNDQVRGLLSGANGVEVDAHSVQPYYARRVATAAGMTVTVETREGEVEFKAA